MFLTSHRAADTVGDSRLSSQSLPAWCHWTHPQDYGLGVRVR